MGLSSTVDANDMRERGVSVILACSNRWRSADVLQSKCCLWASSATAGQSHCAANDAMLLGTVTCDTSIDSILRFPSDMIGSPSGDGGDW